MEKEEFYRLLDGLFGTDNYQVPKTYRRRWGQRTPGNGRFAGRGIVRWFGQSSIHVHLVDPVLRRTFTDPQEAIEAISRALGETMTKMYVANFAMDWADEFTVYGFAIMSELEKKDLIEVVDEHGQKEVDFYFGTNEHWSETVDELFDHITFVEITEDEVETFQKIMTFSDVYGVFPDFVELLDL